ncbi:anti-sigma factor [Oceanobacillus senegalensis]|uniref:anti-sigma factor n=1 Tax=Oceanobacillus senegalensis TaxID=1936063 RepID=UPI0015C42A0B|nr:anti-sigma factor [Oceanobacillus senegalensis]
MNYSSHISEEKIIDVALGQATENVRHEVLQHTEVCETCQDKLLNWKQLFKENSTEKPSPTVKEKIWDDLATVKTPIAKKRKKRAIVFGSISSAAIVFLAIGLLFFNKPREGSYQVVHNDDIQIDIFQPDDSTEQISVIPVADFTDVSGNLWFNDTTHEMLLEVDGLTNLADHDYQLWFVYKDNKIKGGEVLSIQDGVSRVFFRGKDIDQFKLLKASVEPIGGSAKPTGPETFIVPLDK